MKKTTKLSRSTQRSSNRGNYAPVKDPLTKLPLNVRELYQAWGKMAWFESDVVSEGYRRNVRSTLLQCFPVFMAEMKAIKSAIPRYPPNLMLRENLPIVQLLENWGVCLEKEESERSLRSLKLRDRLIVSKRPVSAAEMQYTDLNPHEMSTLRHHGFAVFRIHFDSTNWIKVVKDGLEKLRKLHAVRGSAPSMQKKMFLPRSDILVTPVYEPNPMDLFIWIAHCQGRSRDEIASAIQSFWCPDSQAILAKWMAAHPRYGSKREHKLTPEYESDGSLVLRPSPSWVKKRTNLLEDFLDPNKHCAQWFKDRNKLALKSNPEGDLQRLAVKKYKAISQLLKDKAPEQKTQKGRKAGLFE